MKTTNQMAEELTRLLQEKGVFPTMINKDSAHGVGLTIRVADYSWDVEPLGLRSDWRGPKYNLIPKVGVRRIAHTHECIPSIALDIWSTVREQRFHEFQIALADVADKALQLGVPIEEVHSLFVSSLQHAANALARTRV
jgi:hypothetical protein